VGSNYTNALEFILSTVLEAVSVILAAMTDDDDFDGRGNYHTR
jgi:hypothetical protein